MGALRKSRKKLILQVCSIFLFSDKWAVLILSIVMNFIWQNTAQSSWRQLDRPYFSRVITLLLLFFFTVFLFIDRTMSLYIYIYNHKCRKKIHLNLGIYYYYLLCKSDWTLEDVVQRSCGDPCPDTETILSNQQVNSALTREFVLDDLQRFLLPSTIL